MNKVKYSGFKSTIIAVLLALIALKIIEIFIDKFQYLQ
jgi:hypothetical protein